METRGVPLNEQKNRSGFRLDGKVALITGVASGIGYAIAKQFAANGARVSVLDIDEEAARHAASQIVQSGGEAAGVRCDVTDPAQVHQVFQTALKTSRIDILVNNAGVSHIGNLETTSGADFERILNVNVKGVFHCMQEGISIPRAKAR